MSSPRDPARLVNDRATPDAERELLRRGVDIAPPPGAEARVWLGLASAVGAASVATAADASAKTVTAESGTATAAGLTGAKIVALVVALAVAVGVAVGIAVGIGRHLLLSADDAHPAGPVAPVAAGAPSPAAPPPSPAPTGATTPGEAPPPEAAGEPLPATRAPRATHASPARAGAAAAASSSAVRLRAETTLIRDARQALRQGDAARALRLLDECRRSFPAGVLQQERERLAIEALAKSGRASDASARAAAFLRKYPDSPHAAEIRSLGLEGAERR